MKKTLLVLATLLLPAAAFADEGMWTFDHFPSEKVEKKYGFKPTQEWLDHVRLSSVRLAEGCSGSFVSEDGLVMTNHHCAHSCIEQLSTAQKDYVAAGFSAATFADEVKCPEIEVNQLVAIKDVTADLGKATTGKTGEAFGAAQRAEMTKLENECAGGDADLRCEVVTLYHGGQYHLYKYRRFQDVRLVFAPEFAIAFFGGDPDNFMFPRYDLDVSFLRVYQDGKPAKIKDHFAWSTNGARDGELTFVSGHPGATSRLMTVSALEYQRDVAEPERIFYLAELRGMLREFMNRGPEQARVANATLFYVENSYKALRGRLTTLQDKDFMKKKVADESALRAKIAADPAKAKVYGGAWDAIAAAMQDQRRLRKMFGYVEGGRGFSSRLFGVARELVRGAAERPLPNDKRLREYADANLPAVEQELFSAAPVYDDFEIARFSFSLLKLREELGADHPFVKKAFGPKSPEELAAELVKGTKLKDVAVRKALWQGGQAAIDASNDPMILFAKLVDADARAIRKEFEDKVESVLDKNNELVARAQFAAYGAGGYPDATFTLRLSYGAVRGYVEDDGRKIAPFTNFAGAFDRATGREPFALPKSWFDAKPKLDLATPFDFVTDNDIIGGNSGSPMINQKAEVVGLIFDGNIQSLGGDFWFDEKQNRAVAVDSRALLTALDKIYGAKRIADEIRPK